MEKITARELCKKIGISYQTLNNWYKWYNSLEDNSNINLPIPELKRTRGVSGGIRYWVYDDISLLLKFKQGVIKGRLGVMGKITQKYKNKEKNNATEKINKNGNP